MPFEVTESVVEAAIVPDVAVIVAVPLDTAVALPLVVIVATVVLDELQVAEPVRSIVELSE